MKTYEFLGIEVQITDEKMKEIAEELKSSCNKWKNAGNNYQCYQHYYGLYGEIAAYSYCLKVLGVMTKKQYDDLQDVLERHNTIYLHRMNQ